MSLTLDAAYAVDPQVSIRPEPFGALCYHYGNRRLTFLKSTEMVRLLTSLADHETVADALSACHIPSQRWPIYVQALASLEASEMIHER